MRRFNFFFFLSLFVEVAIFSSRGKKLTHKKLSQKKPSFHLSLQGLHPRPPQARRAHQAGPRRRVPHPPHLRRGRRRRDRDREAGLARRRDAGGRGHPRGRGRRGGAQVPGGVHPGEARPSRGLWRARKGPGDGLRPLPHPLHRRPVRRRRRLFRGDGRLRRRPAPRRALRRGRAREDAEHGDAGGERDGQDDRDGAQVGPGEGREARGEFFFLFLFFLLLPWGSGSGSGSKSRERKKNEEKKLTPFFVSLSSSLSSSYSQAVTAPTATGVEDDDDEARREQQQQRRSKVVGAH